METQPRTPYPTDVTDEEWAFVAPYLTLMAPDAPQRRHDLREVFDALRWIVRAGLHFVAFACLMLRRLVTVVAQRP
jgi:transposase